MKPIQCTARIVSNSPLCGDFFSLVALCPQIAMSARPGQFAMVDTGMNRVPYVKRPLAIASADGESGALRFVYRAAGNGTRLLSTMKIGRELTLIGPLGNGYALPSEKSHALLVAGGAGIASIMSLLPVLKGLGCECSLVFGARDNGGLPCLSELRALDARVSISTEDGSSGYHGFPTPVVQKLLEAHAFDAAYVCGPEPMMRAVSAQIAAAGVSCQISLERRMGCGFGACMGCSCKVQDPALGVIQKRVCREGPVFNAEEVIWDG